MSTTAENLPDLLPESEHTQTPNADTIPDLPSSEDKHTEYEYKFGDADEFILTKAPEFYGTKLLPASPTYRQTIIRKALMRVPDLDRNTREWVEARENKAAEKRIASLGEQALQSTIAFPTRIEQMTEDHQSEFVWTRQEITAVKAFRIPRVREAVIAEMALKGDPVAHVIQQLERWRLAQRHPVSDHEITGSQRAFETVMFGIHSGTLPQFIQTLAALQRDQLDLPVQK